MISFLRKFKKIELFEEIINIGRFLPESRFKDFLRSHFRKDFDSLRINSINKIISKMELLEDDVLFVELDNGSRFYVPRTEFIPFEIRYGELHKLGKIKGLEYFDCWGELYRQYVIEVYEKYYKLKRGDIVVDAGTHIGVFTIKSAKVVGNEGKIIAIEPEPKNLNFLQRNIEANKLNNITVVPKGIWSKKGKLKLYLSKCIGRHSFFPQWASSNKFIEVEVDTLDNILKELGVRRVNFIKMNVEGAEVEALKGMEETIKNNGDIKLAIGAHHSVNGAVNGKWTYKTISRQLKEKNFEVQITKEKTVYGWRKFSCNYR